MTDLLIALQITALGMGLVFGAIILLWAMMTLLTSLTADKEDASLEESATDSPKVNAVEPIDFKPQVAALAVSIALAEQELSTARPLSQPPTAIVSAWQLGMRTRQRMNRPVRS
jgi:Na+-transporting methylmalonyl-CoA/oxaloacetate decarboxylase gamma subunit